MNNDFIIFLRSWLSSLKRLLDARTLSSGFCFCCGKRSLFIFSSRANRWIERISHEWDVSEWYRKSIVHRENHLCLLCGANFRQRAHASAVLSLLGVSSPLDFIEYLKKNPTFVFYETADLNIFRNKKLKLLKNYIVSEYVSDDGLGTEIQGIRNENLEKLTFPSSSVDIIVNSDVLEHVANIDSAISEIFRVLKLGGFHIFTVPVDIELEFTRERAVSVAGEVESLLPPVYHGDTIRRDGVLVFRDFGKDVKMYLHLEGLAVMERQVWHDGINVLSVFFAKKTEQSRNSNA